MSAVPSRLGSYPIERELGRGGMGVVYLGRDPRLNRPIAIKVLPDALALNPESLARFEREAKLLASLNHPNIATIYGIEEADGKRLLVLEYIPGDTLAVRTARGPLSIDEALDVGRQIALAIEAAHEGGVIHRDLKPGNVKITPDGKVKVLDFGLAKGAAVSDAELAHSPTVTFAPTGAGVILGTAGYMSPEQARGKPVDRRTDIWSFGCVLFECFAGKQVFEGETVSDTIAKILEREPDWAALPPKTPARVRELLRRCLEKDLKKRQRDIGDVRIELEEVAARETLTKSGAAASDAGRRQASPVRSAVLAALLVVFGAAAGIGLWTLGGGRVPAVKTGPMHVSLAIPKTMHATSAMLTPDGRTVIVSAKQVKPDGTDEARSRLYSRRLDEDEFKPIPGTEDTQNVTRSRDSAWLAVVVPVAERSSQQRLVKVPVDGSAPPVVLTDWDPKWRSLTWLESGDIVVSSIGAKVFRLPKGGGAPTPEIALDLGSGTTGPLLGQPLPHDRGVFFVTITYNARGYQEDEWVLDLVTNKPHKLIENAGSIIYSETGHVVFTKGNALMAAPFALDTLSVTGDISALSKGFLTTASWENGAFQLSEGGTLLFPPGGALGLDRQLVIVDAAGGVTPFAAERREYDDLSLSRDGRRAAVVIASAKGTYDVWVVDQDHPVPRRAVTMPNADCDSPVWSPDGQQLAFTRAASDKDDGIYVQAADGAGAPQLLLRAESKDVFLAISSWAPDGSALLVDSRSAGKSDMLLVPLPAGGQSVKARPLRATPSSEGGARFSPDGHLLAFGSDESGQPEIYVAVMGADGSLGPPRMVSNGATSRPSWAADGRRLFYSNDHKLTRVTIETKPVLSASTPVVVTDLTKQRLNTWELLPDGRVLGIQHDEGLDDVPVFTVVLNFFDELRARMPKGR